MNDLQIITNYHWRPFVYRHDVPAAVLADDFDYQDDDVCDGYFEYRGRWYHLDEFMRINRQDPGCPFGVKWNGYASDSFFCGVLLQVSDDGEEYRVGTYLS